MHPTAQNAIAQIDRVIRRLQRIPGLKNEIDVLERVKRTIYDLGEEALETDELRQIFKRYNQYLPPPDEQDDDD